MADVRGGEHFSAVRIADAAIALCHDVSGFQTPSEYQSFENDAPTGATCTPETRSWIRTSDRW